MRVGGLVVLLVLVTAVALLQSVALSKGNTISPNQATDTQVTYTISLSGSDSTTLSIDGGPAITLSKSYTVTLDGSQPHTFQVPQVNCQSGWECGDKITDWRNGERLVTSQSTWTVPAGTTQTQTYTETIPEYYSVCVAYDSHGSCISYGEEYAGSYTQTYTRETFTPPCKPCQFTFQYKPQYRLVWNDNYSSVYLYKWSDSCSLVSLQRPSGYSSLGHGDTVAGSAGVQYAFNGWTLDDSGSVVNQVTMCAPHQVTATYLTQYQLQLNSQCPDTFQPTGAGWYNAGSNAPISIQENAPMNGFLGLLGGRSVFASWIGTVGVMGTPNANVYMNQPQTYTATCTQDYTLPAIGGGAIIILIGIGIGIGTGFIPLPGRTGGGRGGGGAGALTPPPNITGTATVTGKNGIQTQLKSGNLNQVGPGTTVETAPKSLVRVQTPNVSNSNSIIGQDSRVSWLDPTAKTKIPWLRFPASLQNLDVNSLARLDFGKLMLNWMGPSAAQAAVVILPASLIGLGASAAMSRWLARVKGNHVLFEAAPDGTAAAITVLAGETGNEGGVELWRSDDTSKVIEVRTGERVVLRTGENPTETKVDLTKDFTSQLQDPFGTMPRWWKLPPMSGDTNALLTTSP